jgi:hypothetical protein
MIIVLVCEVIFIHIAPNYLIKNDQNKIRQQKS